MAASFKEMIIARRSKNMRVNKKLLEQMSNVRRDAHDIAVIENIFHSLIVWIKSGEKPHIQKDPFDNERLNNSFHFLYNDLNDLLNGRFK